MERGLRWVGFTLLEGVLVVAFGVWSAFTVGLALVLLSYRTHPPFIGALRRRHMRATWLIVGSVFLAISVSSANGWARYVRPYFVLPPLPPAPEMVVSDR